MSISMLGVRFEEAYSDVEQLMYDMQKAAKQTSNIIYRGISREIEKYPTLMRVRKGKGFVNLYRSEFTMLRDFRREGAGLLNNGFSALDLVCTAQHFGLPTRLIDWTRNPYVALFFSLSKNHSCNYGEEINYQIYLCDVRKQLVFDDFYFEESLIGATIPASDKRLEFYEGFIRTLNQEKRPDSMEGWGSIDGLSRLCRRAHLVNYDNKLNAFIVLQAGNANPRISAQKGVFIIPRRLDKQSINKEYISSGAKTITISKEIRNTVLEQLERLGFSRLHLFFDLSNLCEYIKDKALE